GERGRGRGAAVASSRGQGAGVAGSGRGKQPRAVEPGSGGTPREDTRCPATRTWAQRTGPNRRPAPIATGTTAVAAPYAGRPTYARPPLCGLVGLGMARVSDGVGKPGEPRPNLHLNIL